MILMLERELLSVHMVLDARKPARKAAPKARESVIEAHLVKRVAQLGGHAYKWVSPGRVGVPDRIVMLPDRYGPESDRAGWPIHRPPRTIFVELKATGQEPKPHQLREHERLRALGQTVVVIDSIEQIEALLENT